ncbi:hypothetical protein CERSUDRAFT_78183 [Gelatoporia subvermispora B]|uniref:DUF6534 domain-containing protein n=1 Tax=Ceriporiopsis subvermispora (strain B) TaxID=914234 RepID=M2Q3N2_CERS8|nr:hypothetical protein CERSUDRAFT_78183 [Gelatoporia subvermispora B]
MAVADRGSDKWGNTVWWSLRTSSFARSQSVEDRHHPLYTSNILQWSLHAGSGAEILADGIITALQYFYLRRFRSGMTFKTILCLITYAAFPDMFIYWPFYFVLGKLYINALLANLNAHGILQNALVWNVHGTGKPATTFDNISTLEIAAVTGKLTSDANHDHTVQLGVRMMYTAEVDNA